MAAAELRFVASSTLPTRFSLGGGGTALATSPLLIDSRPRHSPVLFDIAGPGVELIDLTLASTREDGRVVTRPVAELPRKNERKIVVTSSSEEDELDMHPITQTKHAKDNKRNNADTGSLPSVISSGDARLESRRVSLKRSTATRKASGKIASRKAAAVSNEPIDLTLDSDSDRVDYDVLSRIITKRRRVVSSSSSSSSSSAISSPGPKPPSRHLASLSLPLPNITTANNNNKSITQTSDVLVDERESPKPIVNLPLTESIPVITKPQPIFAESAPRIPGSDFMKSDSTNRPDEATAQGPGRSEVFKSLRSKTRDRERKTYHNSPPDISNPPSESAPKRRGAPSVPPPGPFFCKSWGLSCAELTHACFQTK